LLENKPNIPDFATTRSCLKYNRNERFEKFTLDPVSSKQFKIPKTIPEINNSNIDEEDLACNNITFISKNCDYGREVITQKLFHYSDITSRIHLTKSKDLLDRMPSLPQLEHLAEPILYRKILKSGKGNFDLSFSEEVAGSNNSFCRF